MIAKRLPEIWQPRYAFEPIFYGEFEDIQTTIDGNWYYTYESPYYYINRGCLEDCLEFAAAYVTDYLKSKGFR